MSDKPNIIIIMTDQQRADLSAREGFPLDTMPFVDHLATQGTWFNRAYTTIPACAPARVSMLTGRYPSATKVRTNHNLADATFGQDMFQFFHEQGYRTSLCGKNHSHVQREDVDFYYGATHLTCEDDDTDPAYQAFADFMKNTHFHLSKEATPFPLEIQFPYRVVSKAQSWIKSIKNEPNPFFLWLSIPEPHNPYQVPEPYFSLFPPEVLPATLSDKTDADDKGF
ncbi:MAG: sulfatase-like hydrolase/transferase [Chloroflexota bacterium]